MGCTELDGQCVWAGSPNQDPVTLCSTFGEAAGPRCTPYLSSTEVLQLNKTGSLVTTISQAHDGAERTPGSILTPSDCGCGPLHF